ncbi:hypothetical protein EON80_24190 [bacterium]|nr:MAG: hypothetical protein EON80_24190 [bacterium]
MESELYKRYALLKASGRRNEAKACLDAFLASFKTLAEKQLWVFEFLESGDFGHKIRHEIYEELIYPVLLDGYLKQDPDSVEWLAKTTSNLHEMKSPHPSLWRKGEYTLLREAYELRPRSELGAILLQKLLREFEYAHHEWPMGILYGSDGATKHECEEYLRDIEFARSLDTDLKHSEYLNLFEAQVREYLGRI